MQFKNKLYLIVLLSQQKRTSKYIKVHAAHAAANDCKT